MVLTPTESGTEGECYLFTAQSKRTENNKWVQPSFPAGSSEIVKLTQLLIKHGENSPRFEQ